MQYLPFAPLLALSVLVLLLERQGYLQHLWVFPLTRGFLWVWLLWTSMQAFLSLLVRGNKGLWLQNALSALGLTLICFLAGEFWLVPLILFLVGLQYLLHLFVFRRRRLVSLVWLALLMGMLSFGHKEELVHPGLAGIRSGFFLLHLLPFFLLFRSASLLVASLRGDRVPAPVFALYLLHPAFWLSPLHACYLTKESFRETQERLIGFWWFVRGLLTAVVFSVLLERLVPKVNAFYFGEHRGFGGFLAAGAGAFLLAYVEKSRVSYMSAGFLRLSGYAVVPDFRSPWLARSLLDYWRRFHSWVYDFFVECLYAPLSYGFWKILPERIVIPASIFFTFFLGSSLSHFVSYPGKLSLCFLLAFFFGALTTVHAVVVELALRRPALRRFSWLGVPATWLSVMALYALAYPVFGLAWGPKAWFGFFF